MAVTLKTSAGDIKLELFCDLVPRTCEHYVPVATMRTAKIHRNIKGFICDMGDPTGTGKGGECIWGGTFESEFHPTLKHNARGLVSMANSRPDANGSQFFITYAKQVSLDGTYPIFGRVIHGQDVLDYLEKVPVDEKYRPLQDIRIKSVKVHANPIAEGSV